MLVEINLLPQKEPKKIGFIILASLIVLFLLIGGTYFWQIKAAKNEMVSLDKQISMTKKISDKESQNTKTAESTNSISQLKSAIDWADNFSIDTIPVMRHLTSLLPARGFIQTFGYTESGAVTLTVQFDSAREAAYFLDSLNESKWIKDASLNSLTTITTETETNATSSTVASNSQANPTSATNSASNQPTTDSTATANSQNNQAAGTTSNQNSTNNKTSPTTNSNTPTNNTPAASTSTVSKPTNDLLPRYTGQFEINFNKETIKEIIKKSKKDGEGVTGS